jgi:type IX secretion system PorP/SprF family membrane protein
MKIFLQTFFATTLLAFIADSSYGQNPPVFSHFYANPYQFNPSYVAGNGFSEANLFYRRQWLGINNTPTVMAVNAQAPVGRNVSVGLNAFSDKSALLSSTSALATFGYRVRFNYMHHLNFGISVGVGFNSFDFVAIEETNDPALADISSNNTFLNGQFGLNYQWKNLNIGFAFPKLFDSKPNSIETFNEVKFDKFDNRFASVSYTFKAGDISLTPVGLYRSIGVNQDQLEGMLIAKFKNVIWLGGSYRDGYGVTGFIGINVKGLLRLGYAYEKATGDIADVVDGSHEIFLGARIGKRDREQEWTDQKHLQDSLALVKKQIEQSKSPAVEEPVVAEKPLEVVAAPVVEEKVEPTKPEIVQVDTTKVVVSEPVVIEQPTEAVKPEQPKLENEIKKPLEHGHYVVVGVYKMEENATKVANLLKQKGHPATILYYPEKDYYYVYLFKSLDRNEALRRLQLVKRQNQFFAAWVFTVE